MDLIKERPLEFIGDITDKKDFWKLAVRVQDKWTVVKNGKEHLELVIVDSKGHDVQVVVPTDYKANSDKILEPNTTYVLSNFQVMINNLTFKASDHKFHLKWTGGTTAVDVNVHNIPATAIKFKSFAEIIAGKWKPDLLVNVIGVVQDMGYCQLNEGSGKKLQVNFTMRDLSDMTLNCTLWEDYAAKFIKYMGDKKQGGPVVVMLKYAKIKEEGRYPLTVSNTYGYTRLFINDNLPEINNFKGSLPKDDVSQSQSQLMCTQSYSSSQLTSEEDFLSNNMILPIANIIQLDQITYCVTAATIEKVKSTRHGWYYFACHKCPKIAKGDNAPYTCEDGHNTETEIVKYKLEMEISYEGEVVTFVFWDREVTQLLGVSASHLRSNMIQAGITNRLEYPLMMDGLAGKNFVAKVKWQPRWKTFSVVCLKVEPELFAKVITKFPNYQPASVHVQDDPTDDTIGDIQVQDNDHTVSTHDMSASSEYDPDSLNQITPLSKMKTVDASQNYESLSQLTPNYLKSVAEATPAQLAPPNNSAQPDTTDEITPAKQSSSKRVRLIKQEKK